MKKSRGLRNREVGRGRGLVKRAAGKKNREGECLREEVERGRSSLQWGKNGGVPGWGGKTLQHQKPVEVKKRGCQKGKALEMTKR